MTGKPGGKKPLGRSRHRWKDNIKRSLKKKGWEDIYCTCTSQERQKTFMKTLMNLHRP
jgi:hypothetical protein